MTRALQKLLSVRCHSTRTPFCTFGLDLRGRSRARRLTLPPMHLLSCRVTFGSKGSTKNLRSTCKEHVSPRIMVSTTMYGIGISTHSFGVSLKPSDNNADCPEQS